MSTTISSKFWLIIFVQEWTDLYFWLLYTPYSLWGFYFREFQHFQQLAKINLPPIPTQEYDLCTYAILVVHYTVHVQMCEWYWFLRPPSMIALLLDREFNHSRKCLEVAIREKLDSRNIWRIQYITITFVITLLFITFVITFPDQPATEQQTRLYQYDKSFTLGPALAAVFHW